MPDWTDRWSECQSRVADAVAAVAPFDRLPRAWLIRVLQAVGLLALLSLGVVAKSAIAWVLIAIPMTIIVVLVLSGRHQMASVPVAQRPGPFDVQALESPVTEPSFDSPIVVVRRRQSVLSEPRVVRRLR